MKKLLLMSILLVWYAVPTFADEPEKFSPEKFLAEMEKYITKEAKLTNEEASKFFPLLREMHTQSSVWSMIRSRKNAISNHRMMRNVRKPYRNVMSMNWN